MKSPGKLALVLLLAATTLFGYSAPEGVKIYCTLTWLQVDLKALTIGDWYLLPDEAFLGYGCPVTNVKEDVYVFLYPTSDCGIQTQIAKGKIIFKTTLTFNSKTSSRQAMMPISCTLHRSKPKSWPAVLYIHPRANHWGLHFTNRTSRAISNADNCVVIFLYRDPSLSSKMNDVKEVPNVRTLPTPSLIFDGKWKWVTQ